ncbi:hypothetical protein E1B28_010371 [Marasmius oreades]|uniref:Deoxyribonuclease NucA/NucB domain-containing protein n=1 Tax=Marasmius oreades TaxID=181124 RepID=A0A9P7RXN6_9AGAR|nr:uncharacterized protein E1B28_010371 [Marasmius oreades]KAG7091327.1 hypothetical protein E1B28_010371 [Marasmius oreades]
MSTLAQADLRIASKRAVYDNNKSYGDSETIVLYIYNAGPTLASAPVVKAGYTFSMDYTAVTTTLRAVEGLITPQLSGIIQGGTLDWKGLPRPPSRYVGWDMVTSLPDIPVGMLMELSLSFPMTREVAYADYTLTASVESKTPDPRKKNNATTYVITPNHHYDGSNYWSTPGDLENLDFVGLTTVEPKFEVDLRVASARVRYNNNLPYGQAETLTFFVFNDGPTTANKPVLTAGYTTSMDYSNITCSLEEAGIPDGTNPSEYLSDTDSPLQWQPLDGMSCHIDDWNVICNLPRIPPTTLYRVKISFPMNTTTTYKDYTATASVSSEVKELDLNNNSTTYVITPNHSNDGDAYWQAKGSIEQLDGPSVPSGNQACSTGWLPQTPIIVTTGRTRMEVPLAQLNALLPEFQVSGYDIETKSVLPKKVAGTETRTSSEAITVTFSTDGKNVLTYTAHPDTLVYLSPFRHRIGQTSDSVNLGYWIPVRMLWVGAAIRGMHSDGRVTPSAYVVNVEPAVGQDFKSIEPEMVSASHSYVVGTLDEGGILTHNPKDGQRCGPANVPAMMAAISRIANNLVTTTTPPPGTATPPRHGYSLRYRGPRDPPPLPRSRGRRILPAGVPSRDANGNWLIYLYEEDTPSAVENARYAVNNGAPAILTYDPNGAPQRRRESTGRFQSQSELLQLTGEERSGRSGTGQLDRDEYPPAVAAEGGARAVVTYIEAGDNRRAGSTMGQQFSDHRRQQPDGHPPLQPGDRFRLAIIHRNLSDVEYLVDHSEFPAETQIERPSETD